MLFDAFKARATTLPTTNGLRYKGETHSYISVAERAERAAGVLLSRGIAPGTAVALLLPNSPDLFTAVEACFAIGAIAVPLSLLSSQHELDWAMASCGLGAVIASPDALAVAAQLIGDRNIPVIAATADDLFARNASLPNLPKVDAAAVAAYLFSSGSTGRPKVVPHTHAELDANGHATADGLKLTPDDVVLNALPGHHAFGFMNAQSEAVTGGATTLYWSDPQPLMLSRGRLLDTLAAEGVTVLPGVPFLFDTLAGATEAADMSRLRLIYSSGVGMRRPVYDRYHARFGIRIRQAYGSTETGHIAANLSGDEALWDSVGLPVGDVKIDILPSDSAADGTGEIFITSPAATRGYLNNDAANRSTFVDGGFLSGDLGRIDAEGHVFITGRSKLIIEVFGEKVDPIEIEDALAAHPAVEEAVVVGVPHPRTGEQRLKAVVVRRGDTDADTLLRHSRSLLSAHKVPELIEFRDQIPRSAAGKVLRGKLMED